MIKTVLETFQDEHSFSVWLMSDVFSSSLAARALCFPWIMTKGQLGAELCKLV